jgi:hypothetical protein
VINLIEYPSKIDFIFETDVGYELAANVELVHRKKRGIKKAPMSLEIYKNCTKNGWFPTLIEYKIAKMPFFTHT